MKLHAGPRRPRERPRGVADERSVDVDEGRQPPAEDGTHRRAIAAGTELAPPQEAYGAYAGHATICTWCRDIDRDRCSVGDALWSTYLELSDAAYQQLRRT